MKISEQGEILISDKGNHLVFLLSMPRSGSTLLSLMLGSHPEICCPPEPWIVLAVAEYLELGNVKSMPYGREWAEIATVEFLFNPERKRRGALGAFFQSAGAAVGMSSINAARQVLQAAYQLHLEVSGKSVFIDKTPRYYTALGLIGEIFPRAKKIVLLRNPLDVFASHKAIWEISRDIFTPEGVSVHTRDFCEGLFTLADYTATAREDVLVLRYEDLASDPENALRSACEFSGTDFSPVMLAYYENTALIEEYRRSTVGDPVSSSQPKPTNNRTVNAWEKRLEGADIQALIGVLGIHIFERMGYGDTAARLRNMALNIPTEEQAYERRNLLMHSLVENVHEEPFSIWNNFVSPLKELRHSLETSESDRAARLEVIHQQQAELDRLAHSLETSDALLEKQKMIIERQESELEDIKKWKGFFIFKLDQLKSRMVNLTKH